MNAVLKAYWPSIWKYRYLFIGANVCMVVHAILRMQPPFFYRQLAETFIGSSGAKDTVYSIFCFLGVLLILLQVTIFFYDWLVAVFQIRVMTDIDARNFSALQRQSMRFFEDSFAGSLGKYSTRFRNAFEVITDAYFFQIGYCVVLTIMTLFIFAWEAPSLACIFVVWATCFLGVSYNLACRQFPLSEAEAAEDSRATGVFIDSLSNHATVRSFGKERYEEERFAAALEILREKRKRAWMRSVFTGRVRGVMNTSFEVAVLYVFIHEWSRGAMTIGDFVFFQTYILSLMRYFWDLSQVLQRLFTRFADGKEMAAIHVLSPEVQDAPGARPLLVHEGKIEFHAVLFCYQEKEKNKGVVPPAIQDFSLIVRPGESVGLVGHSGAGKTTLVKLLFRYYDLNAGYICIDGQDITTVTQMSLRQHIALVPQQPDLFHRTIGENILFARPDATEEELIDATRRAHMLNFIEQSRDGFQTLVGERGIKLSGGERQRIALARAFLADAPILVLDEATSALDSVTERHIQEAIGDLLKRRTSIVIAHRLSTIMRMDRIVVMEDGRIVEEGTHTELLEQRGVYADLWQHQSGGYIC